MAYELYTGKHPYQEALSSRHPAVHAREQGMKPIRPSGLRRRQWQALSQALDFAEKAGHAGLQSRAHRGLLLVNTWVGNAEVARDLLATPGQA